MTDLRTAAQAVLDRWDSPRWEWHQGPTAALMADLRAALAEPVKDTRSCTCHPDDNPPKPCPRKYALGECRATELVEQDGACKYCTDGCPACDARKQRKPLTEEEIEELIDSVDGLGVGRQVMRKVARAIERAHGIT